MNLSQAIRERMSLLEGHESDGPERKASSEHEESQSEEDEVPVIPQVMESVRTHSYYSFCAGSNSCPLGCAIFGVMNYNTNYI